MRVIKKEHKEERLNAFIADKLSGASPDGEVASPCYLLLVRSNESPVMRALSAQADALAKANIGLKVIFAIPSDAAAWPHQLVGHIEARVLRDARLMEAHEQLWIDNETAWIGDCMRRDPSQRDAYECCALNSTETARSVLSTFKRIWQKAEPTGLPASMCAVAAPAFHAAAIDIHVSAANATNPPPTSATRH